MAKMEPTMSNQSESLTITHTEYAIGTAMATWDATAQAGYLYLWGVPRAVAKTVEIEPGLNLDLDGKGQVVGVETIGHAISSAHLVKVLQFLERGV